MSPGSSTWLRALAPLAAVAAHVTALANGLTWLDHGDLERGAALAAPGQWLALFSHGFARTGFYRPLTALSLSIDALAGAPWAFHLGSVLAHALAASTLVLAGEGLGLKRAAAVLGGVLFAVHPITSVVADQVSFRAEALVAAALFGVIAAHRAQTAGLALLLVAAAGLTKETGLVLAPLFVVGMTLAGPRPRLRLLVAEAAGWLVAVGLRLAFAPAWRSHQPDLSGAEAVGTRLASIAKSAGAVFVPPGVCDAIAVARPWDPWALAGVAVVATLVVVAWRQWPIGALLLGAVLPSLNLVAAPRFWSPHYVYLPWAFGALLIAAWAVEREWARRSVIALAIGAALVSVWDARRFADDVSLFGGEAARPECREAQLYLGDARRLAGKLDEAAQLYERAAASVPGFIAYSDEAAAQQNLGLVRLQQAKYFEAELAFTQALERTADPAARDELTHNLAAVAVARGDPAGAAALLEPLVSRPNPRRASMALLARALHDMGRDDEARALLARMRSQVP